MIYSSMKRLVLPAVLILGFLSHWGTAGSGTPQPPGKEYRTVIYYVA
jgi:hypothetical protein